MHFLYVSNRLPLTKFSREFLVRKAFWPCQKGTLTWSSKYFDTVIQA